MKRKVILVLALLLSMTAAGLSDMPLAGSAASDSCGDCQLQCANEAFYIQEQCWRRGGSLAECKAEYDQYVNNCKRLFCRYGGLCN